ncbi:MAG: hypothetical protein ACXWQ5_00365 [Ktedonobacterales bacterium]
MRGYKLYRPGHTDPSDYDFYPNLKGLKDLPEGTEIVAFARDRDGQETDAWNIPIVNGKPKPRGRTIYGKGTVRQYGPRRGQVRS